MSADEPAPAPAPDASPGREAGSPGATRGAVRRIYRAFYFSLDGLRWALRNETAFRQEAVIAAVLIPVACLLPAAPAARALLVLSVLLVLITELLNSALEAAVDYVSTERHPLAKRAKDMGSAAVFIALLNVLLTWLIVVVDLLTRGG